MMGGFVVEGLRREELLRSQLREAEGLLAKAEELALAAYAVLEEYDLEVSLPESDRAWLSQRKREKGSVDG